MLKLSWETVRGKLIWKPYRGKRIASVKKFLGIMGKPKTNPERSVAKWKQCYGPFKPGAHFFQVPRSLVSPARRRGGAKEHVCSEDIFYLAHGSM